MRDSEYPPGTLARCKKGWQPFFEVSERMFRIARPYGKAVEVFKQPGLGPKWLNEPAWTPGVLAPLESAESELMAKEVEAFLRQC